MRPIFATLFLIFTTFSLHAQNMSVQSFRLLENSTDAQISYPEIDQNGEKSALIKVVTTHTGFEFDGGMLGIVKTVQKTAEIWVYVPNKAKAITIKHPQLGIIRNYAYTVPIVAPRTYELVLVAGTIETIVKPVEIITQWLVINSKPEGANVLIEGNLAGTTPFSRKYPEGTYSYRVELPRYHTDAGKVTLQGGRKVLDVTFRPKFGNVSVSSTPESGMQIYVNDENTGKTTPATLTEIASGEQTIKLMSQWYQSQAKRVTIADNQTTNVTFALEPAFSEITVNTTPTADILVDGTRKGSGTITSRMLPGVYTIKAEKEKHKPDQKQITVTSNSNQTINLILQPMQGNLDVATNPFDANITLDGKSYGTTPNTIRNLLVGSYSLQLTKTGYGTITKTITITEGKTAEINETLPAGIAVTITSTPTGAELYVDGSRVGTTPYTATLGFGS
ncbi:MAG: PEGA domain-containing protein, partial [Salinivirgaceae bacterium]|nr:PEGA domain-containing protein [Salinivirgaceae bacterium]